MMVLGEVAHQEGTLMNIRRPMLLSAVALPAPAEPALSSPPAKILGLVSGGAGVVTNRIPPTAALW